MAPKYTVYYFSGRGRAEVTRWLLLLGGAQFEDKRFTDEQCAEFMPKTPFGQLPVLEVDGVMIAQSWAMATYVAREYGFMGGNNLEDAEIGMICGCLEDTMIAMIQAMWNPDEEQKAKGFKEFGDTVLPKFLRFLEGRLADKTFLVGGKLTLADVAAVSFLTGLPDNFLPQVDASGRVKKLVDRVTAVEPIAKWIATRPDSLY